MFADSILQPVVFLTDVVLLTMVFSAHYLLRNIVLTSLFHCVEIILKVYCGQTVERIRTKLGVQVGLGPAHSVIDGDTAPLPQRGTAPNFWPTYVVAKWLDGLRCHLVYGVGLGLGKFVLDGDPALPPEKGAEPPSPIFGPCVL